MAAQYVDTGPTYFFYFYFHARLSVCLSAHLSASYVQRDHNSTKRRKTKISMNVPHGRSNLCANCQLERPKVTVKVRVTVVSE